MTTGTEHSLIENTLFRDAVQKTLQCPDYKW